MRFKRYLTELVTNTEVDNFISRWKKIFASYGVNEFELSNHFLYDRLNDKRNNPPITIDEMNLVLNGFLKKMGKQFRVDIESVKNHVAKPRGKNKKDIPFNNLEFAVTSSSTKIKFVFVLKQNFNQKGTAVIVPMTIIRDKTFKIPKGEQIMVESN